MIVDVLISFLKYIYHGPLGTRAGTGTSVKYGYESPLKRVVTMVSSLLIQGMSSYNLHFPHLVHGAKLFTQHMVLLPARDFDT